MFKFIYSGTITDAAVDKLMTIPWYSPIDVLVSWLDVSTLERMISYKNRGAVKSLFIDCGAYSVYKGSLNFIDIDKYIDFVNSIDEHIYAFAQLDEIPGKFAKKKNHSDFIISAEKTWENYLYMRDRVVSPEKLVPVFHCGEDFDVLKRMIEYRDKSVSDSSVHHSDMVGDIYLDRVNIVGLSPMNDSHVTTKEKYLNECYEYISQYGDVKTHLFGMTSLPLLSKLPCYSADSQSHRLRAAYSQLYIDGYGVLNFSERNHSGPIIRSQSFLYSADSKTISDVANVIDSYGYTYDDIRNSYTARIVVDICETQKAVNGRYRYNPKNTVRVKRII